MWKDRGEVGEWWPSCSTQSGLPAECLRLLDPSEIQSEVRGRLRFRQFDSLRPLHPPQCLAGLGLHLPVDDAH